MPTYAHTVDGLLTPALYGAGTALPLVVGAALGAYRPPSRTAVGFALAFASGALLTGLAFELFEPALASAGRPLVAVGLFLGTGCYVGAKRLFDGRATGSGDALLAAVIFDGLAENLTLGVALVGTPTGGPLAILLGVAANNLPEAIGGAADMIEGGRSVGRTLGLWTATAAGLALAVVAGYAVFARLGGTSLAFVRATGGGAVLASLAVEIMPDAYEEGGSTVAFATAAGFGATLAIA